MTKASNTGAGNNTLRGQTGWPYGKASRAEDRVLANPAYDSQRLLVHSSGPPNSLAYHNWGTFKKYIWVLP